MVRILSDTLKARIGDRSNSGSTTETVSTDHAIWNTYGYPGAGSFKRAPMHAPKRMQHQHPAPPDNYYAAGG